MSAERAQVFHVKPKALKVEELSGAVITPWELREVCKEPLNHREVLITPQEESLTLKERLACEHICGQHTLRVYAERGPLSATRGLSRTTRAPCDLLTLSELLDGGVRRVCHKEGGHLHREILGGLTCGAPTR